MTEEDLNFELCLWKVDEAIECLPVSSTTQVALLAAMPGAYDFPPPGEDDSPPEPDAQMERKLQAIWGNLSEAVKKDVTSGLIRYRTRYEEIRGRAV